MGQRRQRPGDLTPSQQAAQLRRMWYRYEGVCQIRMHKINRNVATREHLQPLALGGVATDDNCVLACNACNQRRNREINYHSQPVQGPMTAEELAYEEYKQRKNPLRSWDFVTHPKGATMWEIRIRQSIRGCIVRQCLGKPAVAEARGAHLARFCNINDLKTGRVGQLIGEGVF